MGIMAYTVAGFCEAYNICKSNLYAVWKRGDGPAFYYVGRREGCSESYLFSREEEDQRKAVAYMEWVAASYFGRCHLPPPDIYAYLEPPRRG